MLTVYQKAVLGILAGGIIVLALVVSAKSSVASPSILAGGGGPLTLVTQGHQGGPVPGIVVTGEAKLNYRPDVAYLTLGAVTQAPTAAAAQASLSDHIAKVLERAKSLGIAERDIANGGYSIQPMYAYGDNQPPRITGFQASQQVVITLRDVNAVGRALDELVKDDGATTAALRFGLSAGKDPETDARTRAIEDARAKAEAMARAAGVRLAGAISITEVGSAGIYEGRDFAVPAAAPKTAVPTGDVELTIRMQVQFGIVSP
jgi:uncharacterized protein YggE